MYFVKIKNKYEHMPDGTTRIYFDNAPGKFTVIDTEDFGKVCGVKWSLNKDGYAYGRLYGRTVPLHRVVLDVENQSGVIVDHINRNPLDNRKVNLRIADQSINATNRKMHKNNTSGFRGVCWNKQKQKFRAQARVNGILINLGDYDSPEEAYKAYLDYMIYYHGFENLADYLQEDAVRFGVIKSI